MKKLSDLFWRLMRPLVVRYIERGMPENLKRKLDEDMKTDRPMVLPYELFESAPRCLHCSHPAYLHHPLGDGCRMLTPTGQDCDCRWDGKTAQV